MTAAKVYSSVTGSASQKIEIPINRETGWRPDTPCEAEIDLGWWCGRQKQATGMTERLD